MTIYALDGHAPQIDPDTWVAPDARLIGKVVLEDGSSEDAPLLATLCAIASILELSKERIIRVRRRHA